MQTMMTPGSSVHVTQSIGASNNSKPSKERQYLSRESSSSLFTSFRRLLPSKDFKNPRVSVGSIASQQTKIRSFSTPIGVTSDERPSLTKLRTLNRQEIGLGPPLTHSRHGRCFSEPCPPRASASASLPQIEITLTPLSSDFCDGSELYLIAELAFKPSFVSGNLPEEAFKQQPCVIMALIDEQSYDNTGFDQMPKTIIHLLQTMKRLDSNFTIVLTSTADLSWSVELSKAEDVEAAFHEHQALRQLKLYHTLEFGIINAKRRLMSAMKQGHLGCAGHVIAISAKPIRNTVPEAEDYFSPTHHICTSNTHASPNAAITKIDQLAIAIRNWDAVRFAIVPTNSSNEAVREQCSPPHHIFSLLPGERRSVAFKLRQGNAIEVCDTACSNPSPQSTENQSIFSAAPSPSTRPSCGISKTIETDIDSSCQLLQPAKHKINVLPNKCSISSMFRKSTGAVQPAPLDLGRISSLRLQKRDRRNSPITSLS